MGASGWSYFTEYLPDPKDALKALHQQVFEAGEYYGSLTIRPSRSATSA